MSERRALIRLREVEYAYAPAVRIGPFSLDVYERELMVVLGPSGSGKTTLLRLIAGLERPQRGSIELAGRDVTDPRRVLPERRSVGMVFQDYALFPHLSVWENVAFGLTGPRRRRRARVEELLKLVGLEDLARRYPHELSGGEQQRVALARALAPRPQVVLLDEPFSNLDADLRREMRGEVREILRATESTAVLVTHDQEEAFELGERIAVLRAGHVEQIGPPEELSRRPRTRFVAEFLGRADFLPCRITPSGVETELGFLPHANGARGEEPGELLVRPDAVEIEPDPDGEAVIVARRLLGAGKLYCLELPSGRRLHSLAPASRALPEGSRVRVRLIEEDLVCFPSRSHQILGDLDNIR
jgi:iron(III) transport system ATP-binding protein